MTKSNILVGEMSEFSDFGRATQHYIRRSLDVARSLQMVFGEALGSREIADHYGIDLRRIQEQKDYYKILANAKDRIPYEPDLTNLSGFFDNLVISTTFDLDQGDLPSFSSYRFLYERLLNAEVRPWLVSSFCAASAMPNIEPDQRRNLLQSISEKVATAPGWSPEQPAFFPSWFEADPL